MTANLPRTAVIGFGEAGFTFAHAGGWEDAAISYDIDASRAAKMEECGVASAGDAKVALADADLVLSLVTADQALPAARDYSPYLKPGAIWCDMNSVAPHTKQEAAEMVEAAGGRYVDVAVMAPVDPARLNVPLLFAGADALEAMMQLRELGFAKTRVVGESVGQASAIKLCRSILVKGMEALTAEMVMSASSAGVLDEVLASLDASEKHISWRERADYNLDRMLLHGRRRSAEMVESAAMIRELGITPLMTDGTIDWHKGLGELGIRPLPDGLEEKIAAIKASPNYKGDI
jgi:3-hydroxyisobutyrate dehydrogenase-like beta-hydroxyacid dehydrogenase